MRVHNQLRGIAGLVVALGLGACGDESGPANDGQFDAARIQQNLATMERVAGTPAVASFKMLGQLMGSLNSAPAITGTPVAGTSAERLTSLIRRIAGLVGPGSGAQLVPVIRSSVLGTTFAYDPAVGQYVADPARTGAPANGVRFVLYDIDPVTHRPDVGAEIGYAVLTDENASSESQLGLRFRVIAHEITYLDYSFVLSGTVVSPTLAVNGFLSDGTDRLEFELTITGPLIGNGGPVRLDAQLEIPTKDFRVTATVEGTAGESSGDGQVHLTVNSGADEIVVDVEVQNHLLDATFHVNGKLLATAEGDPEHPVIKGEGGAELTAEEMAALQQIVGLAEGLFHLFYELLEPVGVILGIGVGV
jgi:hypothetical protein